jgi:hypothetical protein
MATTWVTVDNKDVLEALDNLIFLLSPIGAAAFLGVNIGPYLSRRAKERFESEGDDVTGPWAPLKPSTVAIRQNEGYGGTGPINHRTGELENWVVQSGWNAYPTGFGATMRYPKKEPQGQLRDKVTTAQTGRTKTAPSATKRPVLGLNEADLLFYQASLQFAIYEAIQ